MPKVVIDITAAGSVKVDAQGFKGASCEKATEQIELVLGGAATKKKKPERYAAGGSTRAGTKHTF